MRFLMLLGAQPLRAPEDDRGFDLNEDLNDGEVDEVDDEVEVDAEEGDGEVGADHGEEDDDAADEGQGRQVKAAPSRGERRFQALTRENRETRERAERLEREIQEIRQAGTQRTQQESEAVRAERLALMDPDERTNYLVAEVNQRTNGEIARLRFEMADREDRADFRALCSSDPVMAKLKDKVEETLAAERRAGRAGPNRETIATFLLGQMARERGAKAAGKQSAQAGRQRERQAAKPGGGRSDAGRGGAGPANDRAARAKRLADLPI